MLFAINAPKILTESEWWAKFVIDSW
jgi:hypothetical protein